MLRVIENIRELAISQIAEIYETTFASGSGNQFSVSPEIELYQQICDSVLNHGGRLFFWYSDHMPVAALRCEPYEDGYLIFDLETKAAFRRRGFACSLISAVQKFLCSEGAALYSHVAKNNKISLKLHDKTGFSVVSDHATLIDGTVSYAYVTLIYRE